MDTGFMPIGLDMPNRVFISEDPIGFNSGDVNFYSYVGNSPVNYFDPMGLMSFDDAISGAGEGFKHGWDSGYYKCYFKCMAGPFGAFFGAHAAAEFGSEQAGEWAARGYYGISDGRFKAWGKYSKSLVPKAGQSVAKYMRGAAAAWFAYDAWHCIFKCKNCL
jgi:uncharacterized protein RhaS with RHS repeats